MGVIFDSELRDPNPSKGPEPSGSISGELEGVKCTATLLTLDSGLWEYGTEIPIRIVPNQWFELSLAQGQRLFWSGIQVALKSKDLPSGAKDLFLTAALQPASCGWSACAPLRRVDNHKDRNDRVQAHFAADGTLYGLGFDPFHRTKGEKVARLNDPKRLYYNQGNPLTDGFLIGTKTRNYPQAIWRFGLCPQACLDHFEIPSIPKGTIQSKATVQIPRTPSCSLLEAARRFALAGRPSTDPIKLKTVLSRAWDVLERDSNQQESN